MAKYEEFPFEYFINGEKFVGIVVIAGGELYVKFPYGGLICKNPDYSDEKILYLLNIFQHICKLQEQEKIVRCNWITMSDITCNYSVPGTRTYAQISEDHLNPKVSLFFANPGDSDLFLEEFESIEEFSKAYLKQ